MTDSTVAKKPAAARKPAASKTAAAVVPAAKPDLRKPAVPAPKPVLVQPEAAAITAKGATLKMKDLVGQVTVAAGGKKKGVKEIVEATLAALAAALARGDAINLPGFGRARVAHAEDKAAGKPMTIKLKSGTGAQAKNPGKQGLADTDD